MVSERRNTYMYGILSQIKLGKTVEDQFSVFFDGYSNETGEHYARYFKSKYGLPVYEGEEPNPLPDAGKYDGMKVEGTIAVTEVDYGTPYPAQYLAAVVVEKVLGEDNEPAPSDGGRIKSNPIAAARAMAEARRSKGIAANRPPEED